MAQSPEKAQTADKWERDLPRTCTMARTNPFRTHPLLTGLGLVLLALVVAFAICEWRGWPFLRHPLQRMLTGKLERRVEVGPAFRLHTLGSLRVRTDVLSVGPPHWTP